jgi:signal transduction histidine kinase
MALKSSPFISPSLPAAEQTVGLAAVDDALRLQAWSPAFVRWVGPVQPGMLLAEALPLFAGVEDFLRQMPQRGPSLWELHAVRHTPSDGSPSRYLNVAIAVAPAGHGWIVQVQDVTAAVEEKRRHIQSRNEAQLHSSRISPPTWLWWQWGPAFFQDLGRHVGLVFLFLDADLVIEAETARSVHPERSLVGLPLSEAFPALAGLEDELQRLAHLETAPWHLPGLQLDPSRSELWDVAFLPRKDVPGLLMVLRAATTETHIEQELRQQRNELSLLQERLVAQTTALQAANTRLVNLDRERQALMTLIVTDLRSALTVISGYAEWLTRQALVTDPSYHEAAEAIQASVMRVNHLLAQVIELERLEKELAQLQRSPLDLNAVLEELIVMRRQVAALHRVELTFQPIADLPPLRGDARLLAASLGRWLDAILAEAAAATRIGIGGRVWRDWVIVTLSIGLPGRPQATATASFARTLALAQVRLVVEGHGGYLAVDEHKNPIELTVWLPAASASTGPETPGQAVAPAVSAAEKGLSAGGGRLTLDPVLAKVHFQGKPLDLSPLEYACLLHLARNRDRVVGTEELLGVLNSLKEGITLNHLRVLIHRLRHKLGDDEATDDILRTVRGVGYILTS